MVTLIKVHLYHLNSILVIQFSIFVFSVNTHIYKDVSQKNQLSFYTHFFYILDTEKEKKRRNKNFVLISNNQENGSFPWMQAFFGRIMYVNLAFFFFFNYCLCKSCILLLLQLLLVCSTPFKIKPPQTKAQGLQRTRGRREVFFFLS